MKKQQLFQKTTIRLTAVYLGILMLLSLVFSVALFRVSVGDLDRNYHRAVEFANSFGGFRDYPGQQSMFLAERKKELDEAHGHLIEQLAVINAVILITGGAFSYALARRTLEPIEESHMALERFTSDASHELRTPLATMQTEIEVAMMNPKLTLKDSMSLLESNLEEVGRLSTLSERLLTLARIDENEIPKEKVRVLEVIGTSVDAVQSRAMLKKIAITMKLSAMEDVMIQADKASLSEAIIILLDNAIKYSENGKKVTITAKMHHKSLLISIKDKGVGIGPEDLPKIFDRFYRADQSRTKNAEHGHGLGLSLARKIIALHEGHIDVESTIGKGSVFTISLPLL